MSLDLFPPQTIAVVGLSDNPDKPSYQVAKLLLENNYKIVPVNPTISKVLEQKTYPSIESIPRDIKIDIVDIFRKPIDVPSVVNDVIRSGRKPLIWMQEGIISHEAKTLAESHGLVVVMNLCLMKYLQKNLF